MAESVADNILLQIVEETTKHNDNITKQMSADRTLLGKLIEHNEMRDQKQDEQDKIDAEHQGIQSHLSQISDHKLSNIDIDLDEPREGAVGKSETDVPATTKLDKILDETKDAKKQQKDGLELLHATTEKAFGATVAKWAKDGAQWIDDNARFSKFAGNVSADFSIMFGKLGLIQNVPGWKTMTGLLKWIGASLALLLKNWIIAKMGDRMENMVQGFENFQVNWTKRTQESVDKAREERKAVKDKVKKKRKEKEDAPGFKEKAKKRFEKGEAESGKKLSDRFRKKPKRGRPAKSPFRKGMESGGEFKKDRRYKKGGYKTGQKTSKQFKGMTKGMGTIGKIMANIGRGLAVAGTALSAAFTAFVGGITAITAPVWGVVALVVIVIALLALTIYWLYKNWEKVNDWWDRMKVHMAAAIERMMLWKDKAVNWFSDLGSRIGFMLQRLIAVMLDGIAGALNYAIEMFNAIPLVPDVDWRMETGRVEKVDEERAQFEIESKKRGEELERRGIELDKAKDEKMDEVLKQQGGGSSVQQINTSQSQTSKSDVSVTTRTSDPYARQQASR